ncbi:MAG TPA: glycerol-3-phosphate dehydrogenase [Sphingomicrobium sp.]|nr:glycerol-3-phosphate dehydrogenase [Sphingomicrobium sp.]
MDDGPIDLLIVGGGINGAGIARDSAGRGLSVMLVEKDDLAGHTSSASSKLVHGGLRYLEQFEFRLVRESLAERERLLRAAPHIVEPLQFVLPLTPYSRPGWMVRAGLFFYDRLAGRKILPRSRSVRLDGGLGAGLRSGISDAFTYWDCKVQDSRLVVLNAIDAAERGARILTRTELLEARRERGIWTARLRDADGERTVHARALVNAAGPWAAELFGRLSGTRRHRGLRLVKGSHVVLRKLYPGEHSFILQNEDGRVVFAIPFEGEFTLVGTTDVEWNGSPGAPAISEEEFDYLLGTIGRNFTASATRNDIVWSYSGVRGLVEDGSSNVSQVTRDYVLDLDGREDAPLLSVFGGKLTTYRSLSEGALDRLASYFPGSGGAWTDGAVLPGGDVPDLDLRSYARDLSERYGQILPDLLHRLARTYGTRTERLVEGVQSTADLGEDFGAGLHAREVDYLVANEWARSAEDILFRRTKLGLRVSKDGIARLKKYLAES